MINALAQEEQDYESDHATERTKEVDQASQHSVEDDPTTTDGDHEGDDQEDDNDDNDDKEADERELATHFTTSFHPHEKAPGSALPSSVSGLHASQTTDSDDGTPPDFSSPSTQAERPTKTDEHASDNDQLSSSIHAIHRPIAARRRTLTGEPGEALGDNGTYVKQGPREQDEPVLREEPESYVDEASRDKPSDRAQGDNALSSSTSRPKARGRSETAVSKRSLARRAKLADKLSDIFGLDGNDKVVAGECTSVSPASARC